MAETVNTSTTENDEKNIYTASGHIKLHEWEPEKDDIFFFQDGQVVIGRFDEILGDKSIELNTFHIILNHFVSRMPDITKHMNYFLKFYDTDK